MSRESTPPAAERPQCDEPAFALVPDAQPERPASRETQLAWVRRMLAWMRTKTTAARWRRAEKK